MPKVVARALPEWVYSPKKSGLDPLGMHNSSIRLYQSLLPGISNVTKRVRYYGLYAWLSQHYSRNVRHTDPKTWQRFLRRAEVLYALVAVGHQDKGGIAGSDWAVDALSPPHARRINFSDAALTKGTDLYLKNEWGAYGAAYASQLIEIGILRHADAHEISFPTAVGEALGHAFADSVGDAAKRFLQAIDRGDVTRNGLQELASMAPSAIPEGSEEHRLYQSILFAEGSFAGDDALHRRRTLLLILDLARALDRLPQGSDLRWCAYSGFVQDRKRWNLGEPLRHQRLQWRIYQANELCHVAYEALLKFLLDLLEQHACGIDLDVLIDEAVSEVLSAFEKVHLNWTTFVQQLEPSANPASEDDENAELELAGALLRRSDKGVYGKGDCLRASNLLGNVQERSRDIREAVEKEFLTADASASHSLQTELCFLERHAEAPFRTLLTTLFKERIVRRHLWIALRKLDHGDYTFLIEVDEGLVRLRRKSGPVLTTPRLEPAITFLRDLYLLDSDGLTKAGQRALDSYT